MKTGHTEAAGWCLIASALRGDRRLLAVVLGASSDAARAAEAQKLLNWGFQAFDTVQLYQSGKQVTTLRVWKGADAGSAAGFLADRYLTLPKGKADKLTLTMQAQEPLVAPVARASASARQGRARRQAARGVSADRAGGRAAGELLRPRLGHRTPVVQEELTESRGTP